MTAPMHYVYILESIPFPGRHYVGAAADLRARLTRHNASRSPHTSKFGPWRVKTYVALSDKAQALRLERYLKSASGRAFAKKRL